jgi:hypothetical protein
MLATDHSTASRVLTSSLRRRKQACPTAAQAAPTPIRAEKTIMKLAKGITGSAPFPIGCLSLYLIAGACPRVKNLTIALWPDPVLVWTR